MDFVCHDVHTFVYTFGNNVLEKELGSHISHFHSN
jgi:hypothetical protein